MVRWRLCGLVATLLLGGACGVSFAGVGVRTALESRDAEALGRGALDVVSSNPVLVAAGEQVRIPVDLVCVTPRGDVCGGELSLSIRERSGRRSAGVVRTGGDAVFDVTAAALRSVGVGGDGAVEFSLAARDMLGRSVRIPGPTGKLRFHVTSHLPVRHVPEVRLGRVRRGEAVLFVPWGTGPERAGLAPGNESLRLGPPSFDVDARGRVYLADPMQGRVAVFASGRFVRAVPLPLTPQASVAADGVGGVFVADRHGDGATVRHIDPRGGSGAPFRINRGMPSGLRITDGIPYLHVLPADAWVRASRTEPSAEVRTGIPLGDGDELLRVARTGSVRLGVVEDGRLVDAVELRPGLRSGLLFGDLALAARYHDGYLAVVHTWRDGRDGAEPADEQPAPAGEEAAPADQYQVILIRPDGTISTFGVADEQFAEVPPGSRFRLGPDGALYHLTTSPDGVRLVRHDLGEEE